MTKNHIDIITLGCSKNLVDSEKLIRQLEARGYTVAHDAEKPKGNIVIINTCGFIGDAKEESIEMILHFCEKKKKGKIDKLLVMGCLSERYAKELQAEISEVDRFYGKFDFPQIINDLGVGAENIPPLQMPSWQIERTLTTPPHYAYLKIAEGCNRTCSFCAIPLITGRYQSRSIEDLEAEVKWLVGRGVKEFQLIAQDLSYFGLDLYKKLKLAELTARLSDIPGVEWLRLHYAYPKNFPFDVLPVMRERKNVCNYLDIALQHASDKMLKLMRRNFTKAETYDLISRIREKVPDINLRTTLLVGHPNETAEDFEELKQFVRDMRFERMGAFAYSDEEGTFAAKNYADNVPQEIKQQRVDELMAIQQEISLENNQKKIGKTLKTIIDREDAEFYIGRTEYDSPEVDNEVLIKKEQKLKMGEFYQATITDAGEFDLYATI
ncbi:MAG: 30S ribosomal protein S12 methylthiotransferase RimO [Prevotellaceae bacterium]|jgi:ribosomal protein S12 methylthiotransferase|nr:30S ribosomal protein S12 methylthiotransferase RimO [Prevotellaceae bacterium]